MSRANCPICGGTHLKPCLQFQNVPAFANVTAQTQEEALQTACGSLDIVLCQTCGFIFNADFNQELVKYNQNYQAEIGQSAVYKEFLNHVVELVHNAKPLKHGTILEIGCGSGNFLRLLQQRYGSQVSLLGVDPSVQEHTENKIKFCAQEFNKDFIKDQAQDIDLIVSRHMIEHIVDPFKLLCECAESLSNDGILYLETPRLDWILEHKAFFDFGYEHCSYFSDSFMLKLLDAANLQIVSVENSFNEQYFSICARKKSVNAKAEFANTHGDKLAIAAKISDAEVDRIMRGFNTLYQSYEAQANEFQPTTDCCIWGCSQKGEIFLNLFDLNRKCMAVDISPFKQGRFILGTGHQILSPKQLQGRGVNKIIVMNANYLEEIKALVKQICPKQCIEFYSV